MKAKTILAAALFAPLALSAVEVDGVAARVDDAVILRSEVFAEMRQLRADESRFAEVLQGMIERKLILKAAAESKMTMQDWVIENRIREIIARGFDGDRNKLLEALARQRQTYPEWRKRMQDDMVVSAMRWQIIDKNIEASPRAMREEYDKHRDRYSVGRRVTVSVILLKPEDVKLRAEVDKALRSEPFAEVAKRLSADSHAAEGGVWKDVNPAEEFSPEICETIGKLGNGSMSGWVDLNGWSFLVRKDSETEPKTRTFAEAYDDIAENVRAERGKAEYKAWIGRLSKKAYIKVY